MGIRQLLKRAVKPAAMAFVAAGVALSLVVTTPSNAQALAGEEVLIVRGAATMIIPRLIPVAAVLGPVGWGLAGATVLAFGLAATKDYWLPYVTGLFGAPKDERNATPGTGSGVGSPNPLHKVGAISAAGTENRSVTVAQSYACGGSSCTYNGHIAARYLCQNNSTGVVLDLKVVIAIGATVNATTNLSTITLTCNAGYTIKGVEAGLAGDGLLPLRASQPALGPSNWKSWGNLIPAGFDPRTADVKYETTVECVRPDGSKFEVKSNSIGTDPGVKMASCDAASPGSHATGKTTVKGFAPGSTTPETLWDVAAPPVDAEMPLCAPTRPGPVCTLQVLLDSAPCVVGSWMCANWGDLSRDPNFSTRLSCQYGPYMVSMETCNPLERAYEQDGAPVNQENTDGDPATRKDTDPNGNPIPRPAPEIVGVVPGGPATGAPPGSTTEQAECFPSGWAMANPVEWVMKPVGCALDAAFKPKKDLQARVSSMQNQFSNRVPMSWFGLGTSAVSGGSCPTNWALDVSGQHVSLICGTPAEGIIQAFRPVMGAMLVIAALWPLLRSLFYAAIPVFRVTPS